MRSFSTENGNEKETCGYDCKYSWYDMDTSWEKNGLGVFDTQRTSWKQEGEE